MAEQDSNAPPIIKRVKKHAHGGHHGGAWKVAYADFVTAMMAFFLLLWLLNATTEEQKRGIAQYFSPVPGAIGETSGGQGFFQGDTVTTDGKMVESNAPVSVTIPIPTTAFDAEKTEGNYENQAAKTKEEASKEDASKEESSKESESTDPDKAQKLLAELEDKQFREAEHQLRQAIQNIPDIKELADNLIIDNTPEGLRIQLVDQDKMSMFPRGSTEMHEKARLLMHQVALVVSKLPQKISISGHTDSTPYANAKGYDNWDLSTDRANASRRALTEAGLDGARIVNLTGKADTEPLVKDDPTSPQNRRISIVLLREKKVPTAAKADGTGGGKDGGKSDKSVAKVPKPRT